MTQTDLADTVDVHLTAVSHWENGASLPAAEKLPALADALKTTVADLIAGEETFEALARLFEARAN